MPGNELKFKATLDDKVSRNLDTIRKKADMVGGKGTAGSLFGNVGAKAVSAGFGIIDSAISGTIGFLSDASKAAAEEEKSIALLGASLKANVPAWDGNTDAIERVLKSRMKLGFSDDEQRTSLGLIVAATHDVTKALDVQRVAMDLAAFKNISLEKASEALIKVEGGQYRILKTLGIQLPKNATATEALAAVEKVAKGSADALAATNSGKLKASQVEVGEAMEVFGAKILPLVVEGTRTAAGLVTGLAGAFELLSGKIPETDDGLMSLQTTINSLNPTTWGYGRAMDSAKEKQDALTAEWLKTAPKAHFMGDAIDTVADTVAAFTRRLGTGKSAVQTYGWKIRDVNKEITTGYAKLKSEIESAASDVADAMYDPLLDKAELATLELEAKRQRNIRDSAKSSDKEKAAASLALAQIEKDRIAVLGKIAGTGDTATRVTLQNLGKSVLASKTSTAAEKAYWTSLLALLHKAELAANDVANALSLGHNKGGNADRGRAGGGYVPPGWRGKVGEEGEETLVMGASGGGYVIPNAGGGKSKSNGSGGPLVVISKVYLNAREIAEAIAVEQHFGDAMSGGSSLGG